MTAVAAPPDPKRGVFFTLIGVALLLALSSLSPWLLSLTLVLGCGIYVAFEFALVKIPVRQLERDVKAGVGGAKRLLDMKHDMNAMLAACQFGITLTSLGLTLALEPAIHHALEQYEALAAYSAAIAMALGAFFHVTFGELVPKGLALVVPARVLYLTAPFMRMFRVLAVPFIKTCNTIANAVVSAITGKNPDTDAHHEDSVDIAQALVYAHASGEIRSRQLQIMRNALDFANLTAREVMTPARQVAVLNLQDTWAANMDIAQRESFSRLPVIDGGPHDVVGYVRRADLLSAELSGERDLAKLVLPIERRPESVTLPRLNLFSGRPLIALFDEHDSFTGLLTAEDMVEQIVGEIYDETDDKDAEPLEPLSDGTLRISGTMLLLRASDALDEPSLADHEDVDTVGGLVTKVLGRQPAVGDEVRLGRYTARVEAAHGFRVLSVLLTPLTGEEVQEE